MKTKKLSKIKVPSACKCCSCCAYFTPSDGKVHKDPGEGVCVLEHLQYRERPEVFTLFNFSCLQYKYNIHDYFDVKNISDIYEFGDAYCIRSRLKRDINRKELAEKYEHLASMWKDISRTPEKLKYSHFLDYFMNMCGSNKTNA